MAVHRENSREGQNILFAFNRPKGTAFISENSKEISYFGQYSFLSLKGAHRFLSSSRCLNMI
jgi:hypothetical protein